MYPQDHPLIVTDYSSSSGESDHNQAKSKISHGKSPLPIADIRVLLQSASTRAEALDELSRGGFEGIGSNSWAIHGDLTDTGMPYLANDPHLGSQMPSIWYEIGLHCREKSESCQLDFVGFSFAGVPGIIIGHNDRIAWGLTNVGPDVMDLYIEKLNPEDPTQYEFEGSWVDLEVVTETIQIAGKDPIEHTVYLTHHGPIIGSVYGLEDFAENTTLEVPENYALALKWTALEPSCVFCSMWQINQAQDWDEFRKAAEGFAVPSQNLLYADVDGNIGYQMPGNIPLRAKDHDGMLPVPGWTGEYEWQGYIPFEELPYTLNPAEGYIIAANNAVVGSDYPYLISKEWDHGFRAQRILELLNAAPYPITMDYIQEMQGDNFEKLAENIIPALIEIEFTDPDLIAAQKMLSDWDYQAEMDSAPAALFMVFWQNMIDNTFQDDLPEDFHVGVGSRSKEIFRQLVNSSDDPWWDDSSSPEIEGLEDILRLTLEESYQQLRKEQGNDPAKWSWGELHTITFQNQVMSSFPFIDGAFDRGPYPSAGGSEIINATGWDEWAPFEIDWLPSMRMVVDLNDLPNSLAVHTTGQSGHAYHPNYTDMVDMWRYIEYHPMMSDFNTIQEEAENLLILTP
jgi:penicillin amidase